MKASEQRFWRRFFEICNEIIGERSSTLGNKGSETVALSSTVETEPSQPAQPVSYEELVERGVFLVCKQCLESREQRVSSWAVRLAKETSCRVALYCSQCGWETGAVLDLGEQMASDADWPGMLV